MSVLTLHPCIHEHDSRPAEQQRRAPRQSTAEEAVVKGMRDVSGSPYPLRRPTAVRAMYRCGAWSWLRCESQGAATAVRSLKKYI